MSPWQQNVQAQGGGPIRERLAAVDAEGHQAEEDGDADQRGGGRRREELPVLDLTVPQHGQHQNQQRDHQAAHVQRHLDLVGGPRAPRHPRRHALGDVAVQDAVMGQVERGQRLGVVLQQLALVDETHLLLLTRKVGSGGAEKAELGQNSTELAANQLLEEPHRVRPLGSTPAVCIQETRWQGHFLI